MRENAARPPSGNATSVEVYGFVGWIASAVGFVLFLAWAYIPDEYLHAAGVTYHPDKQWAILLPAWVLCSILFAAWLYESANQVSVKPFSSRCTISDDKCKSYKDLGQLSVVSTGDNSSSVLPLMHIPRSVVSRVLHGGASIKEALEEDEWTRRRKN